ncbi:MAG: hypothetical protein IIC67_04210 [Thaumarchaeota archaeon]|nr:hypothetical protein [Nitrososphaerota archaeon]
MKRTTTVTPYRFEEKFWILAFDSALISKFENIDFDVYVTKNKLHIRSQPIRK